MQRAPHAMEASPSPPANTGEASTVPIISIISSDGETFMLSPSTVAHSDLLDGALRKWANVYQSHTTKSALDTPCSPISANEEGGEDDLEETPDENYIARFYGETEGDLAATSGVLREMGSGSVDMADMRSGQLQHQQQEQEELLNVIQVVRHPNDDDETAHEPDRRLPLSEGETLKRGALEATGGDGEAEQSTLSAVSEDSDSDRTTSVLPSSVEDSVSHTTTPFKTGSNCSTPTRVGDAAGVATDVLGASHHTNVFLCGVPIQALSPTKQGATSWQSLEDVGNRSRSVDGTTEEEAAGIVRMNEACSIMRALRSPLSLSETCPLSFGPQLLPSVAIDLDMSTPSVLSSEEGNDDEKTEEGQEQGDGGCATYQEKDSHLSRDPRNLGNVELNSAAAASSSWGLPPSSSPGLTTATAGMPNGGYESQHPHSPPLHRDPAMGISLGKSRHRGTTLVQADAADEDDADVHAKRGTCKLSYEETLNTAAAAAIASTASALSGSGFPNIPSPPPDWRSPSSSCHQRTPCMADEDDLGELLREEGTVADDSTTLEVDSSHTQSAGSTSPCGKPPLARETGEATNIPVPSPTDHLSWAAATASSTKNEEVSDVMTDPPAKSVLCADGIRISSTGIVFDLAQPVPPSYSAPTSGASSSSSPTPLPGNEAVKQSDNGRSTGGTAAAEQVAPCASPGSGDAAPRTAFGIHSSTLHVCIKYMKHFAKVNATVAAAVSGTRQKHRRRGVGGARGEEDDVKDRSLTSSSSSSIATGSRISSDSSDEEAEETSNTSEASFNAKSDGPSPGGLAARGHGEETSCPSESTMCSTSRFARALSSSGPALIPAPLMTPLVAYLSPWEHSFLYIDVLRAPETMLEASCAILKVCPGFDYGSPSMHMRDARVRLALLLPPPPPEGVRTLMKVMAAAKVLQIAPLQALCAGWLADFMIRMSYAAKDNFEAAHLIRQGLCLSSDWSRRETDCLKIENEWPANEEAD